MSAVVNVALPVFAIILAGFLAGRSRLLGDLASEALNKFVYYFALPPVVFLGMARRPLDEILNWPFITAFLGPMLAIYVMAWALGWILHRESAENLSLQALNASFANTGYMGIPLFLTAFGQEGLPPAILATVIMSAIGVGLAVIVLELCRSAGHGIAKALRDVGSALLRNPLVMAPLVGMAVSMTDLPVPVPAVNLGNLLGAAAGPCALFAIGLFLAGRPLSADLAEIGWITALKLIWQPLLTWIVAFHMLTMEAHWARSAVILAALPTGALTFVIAQQYKTYVERTSAVILVSTVLSVLTLSGLLAVYAPAGP
ncbi:AEC family transporter [Arenibaculum pallidiluteum]|uniref:AEC family transporter n=1 Tax=Arenibaculum pallidiluteum TaxID=2812559 RepID=UPI001A973395|nr:AEC family transporter [Arenibaculum pallidiluteum]